MTHPTSMKIPIFNSLEKNNDKEMKFEKINFDKLNKLNFQKIDYKRFPINLILNKIPSKDSLFETIVVSANDTLVELFLEKKITFYDIYKNLNVVLNLKEYSKYKSIKPKNLSQILNLSKNVRLKTKSLSVISKI